MSVIEILRQPIAAVFPLAELSEKSDYFGTGKPFMQTTVRLASSTFW